MCSFERPGDVVSAWAREPDLRRGRISADLAATITDAERALDPSFDGYRIGEIDHIWSFNTPDEQVALDSPLSLELTPRASGFTATFQRGRRGEPTDEEGCEDCFEFIPAAPVWQYTFERRNGCWELTTFITLSEEKN